MQNAQQDGKTLLKGLLRRGLLNYFCELSEFSVISESLGLSPFHLEIWDSLSSQRESIVELITTNIEMETNLFLPTIDQANSTRDSLCEFQENPSEIRQRMGILMTYCNEELHELDRDIHGQTTSVKAFRENLLTLTS